MGDDSLTDDSFLELYTTSKVTSTYNSLLEKIKSSSKSFNSVKKTDSVVQCVDDVSTETVTHNETPTNKLDDADDDNDVIAIDDLPIVPLEEETGLRRSTRLIRAGRKRYFEPDEYSTYNENEMCLRSTRRKNVNKKQKSVTDLKVVEIDISSEDSGSNTMEITTADDDLNYEMSVKVIWKSVSLKTFRIRRFQKLKTIFDHFAVEENIPIEKIYLSLKNRKISPNDTPVSIDLKTPDFIDGGILSSTNFINKSSETNDVCLTNKDDSIVIKVQDGSKKKFKFSLSKNEPLKVIMIRYAEQIETDLNKLKFYFDGETVSPSDTPASLDLDGEEVIDVKIL